MVTKNLNDAPRGSVSVFEFFGLCLNNIITHFLCDTSEFPYVH